MTIFRRLIAGLATLALLLLPMDHPTARGLRGGVASGGGGGGGSTLLTTLTLVNTSGSTQASNFVTDIFGHPFKKGDIANGCTGGAPIFELTNGTNVPFSEGLAPVCWSDGSLKWAPFMLRVPTSIAGSGSLTINVKSGGSTPSSSSRALSDFATSSTDLNVSVDGLDNLSGTWVSNLNQGVSAAHSDDYVYMDGQAGKVWRVRASFRQSSADQGQLEGYWYVQALQDASNGLYGTRALVRITQPWYTVATNNVWKTFSAFTLKNGASTIRDLMGTKFGPSNGKTFTWTSGGCSGGGSGCVLSTANAFKDMWPMRLTTTGSLPSGLSTGTTYFTTNVGTNEFTAATGVTGNSVPITPTTNCTGTCTASLYPGVAMFGSVFTPGATGKPDYIQAGGSVAADHTTRIQFNAAYWVSTRMVPPYMVGTVTPTAQASYDYYPMTPGPVFQPLGGGGERDDLGVEPNWFARHFLNQDAGGTQTARVVGLVAGHFSINLKSKTTYTIPVVNNTTYTGMPAPDLDMQWKASVSSSGGFTVPGDGLVLSLTFPGITFDHMPELIYYPKLVFGDPQYSDMLKEWGSNSLTTHKGVEGQAAVVNGSTHGIGGISSNGANTRDPIINGTHYYGVNLADDSGLRALAWTARTNGLAAGLCTQEGPAGAKVCEYLNDTVNVSYTAYAAYTALLPSFVQTNGLFIEPTSGDNANLACWQHAYLLNAVNYVTAVTENTTSILNFASYLSNYYKGIVANLGVWSVPCYYANVRINNINTPTGNSGNNLYFSSWGDWASGYTAFYMSWTNGSAVFNLDSQPSNYVPVNGDTVRFASASGPFPSAMTTFTTYYMVNAGVGGATKFQLSATPGGSPITQTDTNNTGWASIGTFSGLSISTGDIAGGNGDDNYMPSIAGAMNWLYANDNSKVDATTRNAINTRYQARSSYLTNLQNNPKYAIGSSY